MLDMAAIELLGTFGKRLTALRKERDQNQGEFAAAVTRRLERAGKKETVSNSFISALESGRSSPSLNVLTAILAELDVSADYLVLGIGPPNRVDDQPDAPVYYSDEADEVAQLVDAMPEENRRVVLAVVRVMAAAAGVETAASASEMDPFQRSILEGVKPAGLLTG